MNIVSLDCKHCGSHMQYHFGGLTQCINNCLYRKIQKDGLILSKVKPVGLCEDFICTHCKGCFTLAYEQLNNFQPFVCISCLHWFLGSVRVRHKFFKVKSIDFIDRIIC